MEVLTQNNDFVMFLFSGVLQMAEKILFQKQIKRDSLPCQNKQFWWKQDAEGEELRDMTWRSTYQSWPCFVSLVALDKPFIAPSSISFICEGLLDMRQSLFTACNAIQFFLLG